MSQYSNLKILYNNSFLQRVWPARRGHSTIQRRSMYPHWQCKAGIVQYHHLPANCLVEVDFPLPLPPARHRWHHPRLCPTTRKQSICSHTGINNQPIVTLWVNSQTNSNPRGWLQALDRQVRLVFPVFQFCAIADCSCSVISFGVWRFTTCEQSYVDTIFFLG